MYIYIGIYFVAVSLLATGLTVYDKNAARLNMRRIQERTLLLVAALGGSLVMLVTMRLVRHKTRHAKFMIGIPAIIILQIAVVLFVWQLMKGGAI